MRVATGKFPNSTGLCFSTTAGARTKHAPVLGTEAVESLCLEMPKSCLDVASQVTLGGPAWVECWDQVTSKGPSNLSHSVTLEKQWMLPCPTAHLCCGGKGK